jgi:hypothetical protein
MIHLYPPALFASTSPLSRGTAPGGRLLYLSFEDALDALLEAQVPKGAAVLVPAFYCWSVVEHLESKGCRVISYSVQEDLQTDRAAFQEALDAHQPDMIILFHPLGMRSSLVQDATWAARLAPKTIVLEDYAHRLFNERDDHPFERWIAINSFRKLSAAEGAWVWGSREVLSSLKASYRSSLSTYRLSVALRFLAWRFTLGAASLFESEHLFSLSEWLYASHEALIGASSRPQPGSRCQAFWFSRLSVDRLKAHRVQLAQIYTRAFERAGHLGITLAPIPQTQWGELKFFPLKMSAALAQKLMGRLAKRRCYLDTLYEESPHCSDFVYLMLPLYPSIEESQARHLGNLIHAEAV